MKTIFKNNDRDSKHQLVFLLQLWKGFPKQTSTESTSKIKEINT